MTTPPEFTEIASGLQFPEGPVAMPDGSVVLVEMFAERITRVAPDGTTATVAEVPGGPNGLAVGPDGSLIVCNNGGAFAPVERNGELLPGPFDPARYRGGSVQRVDADGTVTTLYAECDGRPLRAPNDLVMDGFGGFYFTDHGTVDNRGARTADVTGIYYAACDGSAIREVVFPTSSPNGIGLSPDGTMLYYAETITGRVFQRQITEPGTVARTAALDPGALLAGLPGLQYLDSLAVDGEGWVCVATLLNGGITSISPDGAVVEFLATGDRITTNICFGGPDLDTAYITLSSSGRLVSTEWPRPGLQLAHQ
ncbi:SMP-30/gluconolactonase/LRE family protein [Desertimonas flava]|uniref:SMP-30/gluconolactonase/LRE family protein n=1 Tax=Desertimonas flava TaxID=2064846 RepID=UPI001D0BF9CA|nr:SMP-30/gluconolactonase/LRE family protein [Desertimonas flava]